MAYIPEDLMAAERHVAEAEQYVARQEEIITRLALEGADTEVAEYLLSEFRTTLTMTGAIEIASLQSWTANVRRR